MNRETVKTRCQLAINERPTDRPTCVNDFVTDEILPVFELHLTMTTGEALLSAAAAAAACVVTLGEVKLQFRHLQKANQESEQELMTMMIRPLDAHSS